MTVGHLVTKPRSSPIKEPGPAAMAMTREEEDAYQKEFALWMGATQYASVAGTSLRMLAPVLAEASINFVLFVLSRPDVRRDAPLYDSILRQSVHIRVRGMHLSWEGFLRAVDVEAEPFKDFQTLMNGRNDFLDGNVNPKLLTFDHMAVDRFGSDQEIPLFRDDRSLIGR